MDEDRQADASSATVFTFAAQLQEKTVAISLKGHKVTNGAAHSGSLQCTGLTMW